MSDFIKCRIDGCNDSRYKGHKLCVWHRHRWFKYKDYQLKPVMPAGIFLICGVHGELKENEVQIVGNHKRLRCVYCRKSRGTKYYYDAMKIKQRLDPEISKQRSENRALRSTENYNERQRDRHLRKNYGLTLQEYNDKFEKQQGLCKICKNPETAKVQNSIDRIKWLSVDHNHTTKAVRDLLCGKCNALVGYAKEDYQLLQSAITYLKKHETTHDEQS